MGVKDVVVPDIGDFADVPVIEVMVSPGDTVAEEDPLVTLESDKATMDVPAPFGGVVEELRIKTGDTVSEGSVLLTLQIDGDGAGAQDGAGAAEAAPAVTTPAPEAGAADSVDSAIDAEVAAEVADEPAPPVREPESGGGNGAAPASAGERTTEQPPAGGPVYAGPGARRLARELGVDLGAVKGSGRKGRIQKSDVEAAAKGAKAAAAAAAGDGAGLGLIPWPKVDFEKYGEVERVPLSRIKKISGANLHRN